MGRAGDTSQDLTLPAQADECPHLGKEFLNTPYASMLQILLPNVSLLKPHPTLLHHDNYLKCPKSPEGDCTNGIHPQEAMNYNKDAKHYADFSEGNGAQELMDRCSQ